MEKVLGSTKEKVMAKKNKINICAVIGLFMIVAGIIYVIVCTALRLQNRWLFRIIFAAWVALYMILTDFIEPVVTDRFRRKKEKQVKAYYKYAVLDIVGMAGLLWFVVMAGMLDDYTHYAGIAIFIACYVPKNIFFKKFNTRLSYYERYQEDEDDEDDFDIDIFEK